MGAALTAILWDEWYHAQSTRWEAEAEKWGDLSKVTQVVKGEQGLLCSPLLLLAPLLSSSPIRTAVGVTWVRGPPLHSALMRWSLVLSVKLGANRHEKRPTAGLFLKSSLQMLLISIFNEVAFNWSGEARRKQAFRLLWRTLFSPKYLSVPSLWQYEIFLLLFFGYLSKWWKHYRAQLESYPRRTECPAIMGYYYYHSIAIIVVESSPVGSKDTPWRNTFPNSSRFGIEEPLWH